MTKAPRTRQTDTRTRRHILDRLKREGPQDAAVLAETLCVTAMAVRQHLYALEQEGLASFDEVKRGVGRPAKLWRLTPGADKYFPDAHADLTAGLLAAMRETFGDEGLNRLLETRTEEQVRTYSHAVGAQETLRGKLVALAEIRTQEGYMAEVETAEDGAFLFVENHCPICVAAAACSGLCASERSVFQQVLGPGCTVERTDHILAGARRCAYRVAAA